MLFSFKKSHFYTNTDLVGWELANSKHQYLSFIGAKQSRREGVTEMWTALQESVNRNDPYRHIKSIVFWVLIGS